MVNTVTVTVRSRLGRSLTSRQRQSANEHLVVTTHPHTRPQHPRLRQPFDPVTHTHASTNRSVGEGVTVVDRCLTVRIAQITEGARPEDSKRAAIATVCYRSCYRS